MPARDVKCTRLNSKHAKTQKDTNRYVSGLNVDLILHNQPCMVCTVLWRRQHSNTPNNRIDGNYYLATTTTSLQIQTCEEEKRTCFDTFRQKHPRSNLDHLFMHGWPLSLASNKFYHVRYLDFHRSYFFMASFILSFHLFLCVLPLPHVSVNCYLTGGQTKYVSRLCSRNVLTVSLLSVVINSNLI